MTLFLSPGRSLVFGLFLTTLVLMAQQPSSWEGRLSTGIAAIKSGKATEAIQLLVPVTEEAKAFPPEDVRRVEASIVLGSAYQYHGQLDLAEPLYLAAIQWMEAHREISDALLAVAFDNLGRLRLEQARWHEAEELLNRARDIYSKTRNDQDPRIANVNRLLGETLLSQGRIADGVALLEHAVDTLRHASDTPIQTLAAALRSLATAYTVQGRYPEAEGLLDEALRMNRQPVKTISTARTQCCLWATSTFYSTTPAAPCRCFRRQFTFLKFIKTPTCRAH